MTLAKAVEKGNACLADRENIPSAPLWHMGKVAVSESKNSFELLQNTIDYLSCKGKLGKQFTANEKEFMKELFEALWWGGKYNGFKEAAMLANHYVNGGGKSVKVNSKIYTDSIIVKDYISAMKLYVAELSSKNKPTSVVKGGDLSFLNSSQASRLKKGRRNTNTQGYMLSSGVLLVEQRNQRLKNADNRFFISVSTVKKGSSFMSRWKVESIYDFEPFEKGHITDISLTKAFVLKLPDGLSHYLVQIGVAEDFTYTSTWLETWK